ncbi:MAG: DUF111 family protein, partial [Myxococcales bacterium]|nr:DUF111 family protein [Myxococcales bacterium]
MSGRILYLDLVGGAAGDMLLAALVDLGASVERIRCAVNSMGLNDVELHFREVYPESLRALQLDVIVRGRLADTMDGQEGRSTLHTGGGYEGVDTSPLESGSNSQFHDQERSESTPRSYTQTALNRSHEGHSHSHVHEGHSHSHVHEGHSHSHVHEGHSHSHVHEGHSHSHVH